MKHLDEFEAHYGSAVGADPEFRTMTFVAGDWEVIEGRKFTGWILTQRPDFLIPDLKLKRPSWLRSVLMNR